jgi:hypothetical protein
MPGPSRGEPHRGPKTHYAERNRGPAKRVELDYPRRFRETMLQVPRVSAPYTSTLGQRSGPVKSISYSRKNRGQRKLFLKKIRLDSRTGIDIVVVDCG